jgi:hypothetical protein
MTGAREATFGIAAPDGPDRKRRRRLIGVGPAPPPLRLETVVAALRFAAQAALTNATPVFGLWRDMAKYREVFWRLAPEAGERPAGLRFHPQMEPPADGSLARFRPAGWREMTRHPYPWDDRVEGLALQALHVMAKGNRCADGAGLP